MGLVNGAGIAVPAMENIPQTQQPHGGWPVRLQATPWREGGRRCRGWRQHQYGAVTKCTCVCVAESVQSDSLSGPFARRLDTDWLVRTLSRHLAGIRRRQWYPTLVDLALLRLFRKCGCATISCGDSRYAGMLSGPSPPPSGNRVPRQIVWLALSGAEARRDTNRRADLRRKLGRHCVHARSGIPHGQCVADPEQDCRALQAKCRQEHAI
jgi:hypothetical protein